MLRQYLFCSLHLRYFLNIFLLSFDEADYGYFESYFIASNKNKLRAACIFRVLSLIGVTIVILQKVLLLPVEWLRSVNLVSW